MKKNRRYEFDGLILNVPMNYDVQSQMYIEDYSDIFENPVCTPRGSPVMFAGEDACHLAEEATPGGCPDCGSCKYYRRAGEHTWLGICDHEDNIRLEVKEA